MSIARRAQDIFDRKVAGLYALLDAWSGTLEGYAKANASWQDRTGHARQGIYAGVERDDNQFNLYLSHGMEYGDKLEKGTPPHIIRPKNKKALYWPGAAHPVKLVHHPGTKSYAVIGPTLDVHIGKIKETVLDLWSD